MVRMSGRGVAHRLMTGLIPALRLANQRASWLVENDLQKTTPCKPWHVGDTRSHDGLAGKHRARYALRSVRRAVSRAPTRSRRSACSARSRDHDGDRGGWRAARVESGHYRQKGLAAANPSARRCHRGGRAFMGHRSLARGTTADRRRTRYEPAQEAQRGRQSRDRRRVLRGAAALCRGRDRVRAASERARSRPEVATTGCDGHRRCVMTGGIALGPVLSGLLLEHFWWGWVLLINIPAMMLLLLTGPGARATACTASPRRRLGLRTLLQLRRRAQSSTPRLAAFLQSPPDPLIGQRTPMNRLNNQPGHHSKSMLG